MMEELKQCPNCKEFYSSTYRACPFCDEKAIIEDEENEEKITPRRRRGHRENARREAHSARGIIICVLLFALLLMLWYLFGSDVIAKLQHQPAETPKIEVTDKVDDEDTDDKDDEEDDVNFVPEDEDDTQNKGDTNADETSVPEKEDETEQTPDKTPDTTPTTSAISLNRSDFTLKANESFQLKLSGSTAKATWSSENPNVVKVDGDGKVTAVGGGHTTVTATVGSSKASCIVRVNGAAAATAATAAPATPATPLTPADATPAASAARFNKEDVTIKVGESFKLKISGSSAAPVWGVSNNALVTVDQDGTVKGLASGTATVQATVDGKKLSCIVRIK